MPDVLPLAEPAEPAEPEAVEPEPAEPAVLEPAAEPDVPVDEESMRPRTSTFEFTYFSSSLFWPPIRLYVEPEVLPVALLALPDVPAVDPPAVDPPVVDPPVVEPPAVDPLVPEPPLDTVAFINMNPPLALLELLEPDVPAVPAVEPAPPVPAIRHPVTVTSLRWLCDDDDD